MAETPEQQPEKRGGRIIDEKHIPCTDDENTSVAGLPSETAPPGQEPRGIQKGIADPDKVARTGSTHEPLRNTPPAGAWNETSGD